jgi:tetratricopeptide (TPR) repeat protein
MVHPAWRDMARNNLAAVYQTTGRTVEALDLLAQSMSVRTPFSSQWSCLATLLRTVGRTGEALHVARRQLAVGRAAGSAQVIATGSLQLAFTRQQLGHHRVAALLLRAIVEHPSSEVGPALACEARSLLGLSMLALGDPGGGLAQLEAAVREAEHLDPSTGCLIDNNLGEGLRAAGRLAEAEVAHTRSLERAVRLGYRVEQARALEGLGRCSAEPERARQRLRQALELYDAMSSARRDQVAARLRAIDETGGQ